MGRVQAISLLLTAAAAGLTSNALAAPRLASSAGGVGGSASNISYGPPATSAAASAVSSTASSVGAAASSSTSSGGANAQALANEAVSGLGGGGAEGASVTTSIDVLNVDAPSETRPVCAAYRSVVRRIVVNAVCRDARGGETRPLALSGGSSLPLDDRSAIFACRRGQRVVFRLEAGAASPGERACGVGEALGHAGGDNLVCLPATSSAPRASQRAEGGMAANRAERGESWGSIALEAIGEPQCVLGAEKVAAAARP